MQTTSSLCPHSENNAMEYCGYFMSIKKYFSYILCFVMFLLGPGVLGTR